MYTYMHTYMHTYVRACMHAYIHTYVCMHAGMHACRHACRHVCMQACMYGYNNEYMHMRERERERESGVLFWRLLPASYCRQATRQETGQFAGLRAAHSELRNRKKHNLSSPCMDTQKSYSVRLKSTFALKHGVPGVFAGSMHESSLNQVTKYQYRSGLNSCPVCGLIFLIWV